MKILAGLFIVAVLSSGCATNGANNPHADGAGSVKTDNGPTLCKDGSTPPCNERD